MTPNPSRRSAAARHHPPAVLSDLWNTLVYYTPAARRRIESERRRIWATAANEAGVTPHRATQLAQRVAREILRDEARGRTPPLTHRVAELGQSIGRSLDQRRVSASLDAVVLHSPPMIAPGARAALKKLREHRVPVGVVSNISHETADGTRRLLSDLGLAELCDAVVLSADDGVGKPHPAPFLRCARMLRVAPRDVWYIGDLPTDITGARAAGMQPLLYLGVGGGLPPSVPMPRPIPPTIERWADVPRLILRVVAA